MPRGPVSNRRSRGGGCPPFQGAGGAAREPEPAGQWHKTWGGIASSNATADAGVASGRPSKESAEQMALADCSRRGASDCRVIFTYRNQCVAWLVPNSQGGASRAGLASAKEPAEARKLAQQSCVDTDGKSCQVAYEDCTKPVYESFQAVQRNTGFRALRFFWRVPSYSSSSAGVVLRSAGTSDTCSGATVWEQDSVNARSLAMDIS